MLMQCKHKKTKMKLCINMFSRRINPAKWFKMKKCCKTCGCVVEE